MNRAGDEASARVASVPMWVVDEIEASATHPLRRAVLRAGTPTTDVAFVEDDWPGAVHLGVRDGGLLVGTSSWIPRVRAEAPTEPGVQLRGMATAATHQGRGVGAALLAAGIARAATAGVRVVWANARDSALEFYLAHGFIVLGDGFVDATTQLPHHQVVRRLG